MSLAANTVTVLQIALGSPQAANDLASNVNTPTPGATSITSTLATAFTVAASGTNYGLQVDESTANAATGIKIKPAAAGAGVAVSVISSGNNESATYDAKGSGNITIGGVSTGLVSIGRGSASTLVESGTKANVGSGNQTATAAQLLNGYITGAQSANTVTTDTAANIDAAIPGVATGDTFYCVYFNSGAGVGTVTAGSGVTVRGSTGAVPAGKSALLVFSRTGAAAWDLNVIITSA